jgi:hypothetical protein
MANKRTGVSRGTHARHGTLGWRDDPEIMDRIAEVGRLKAKGWYHHEIARKVGISTQTVTTDWQRVLILKREQAIEPLNQHIDNLRELARLIHEKIDGGPVLVTKTAPNGKEFTVEVEDRAQLVAQLRQVEMDLAKLDGSLIERKELQGIVTLLDAVKEMAKE